ncbi:MAG: LamG domain-containing protein [Planctomycetota bacterium]|jgi:hypothetical protein
MSKNLIYLTPIVLVLSMAHITFADLVAHWPFDEGSGDTAHDSSGSGHDGTLMGDPQWVAGKIGGALGFDGYSDGVNHTTDPGNVNWVSVDPFDVVGPGITLAAWIRPDGFDISDARIVTKQKTWSSIEIWWMLSTYTDGTALRMRLKTDDGGADGGTTTMWSDVGYLEAGVWSHVAATYDGSKMRLYHNGMEIMSTNKTGTMPADPTAAVAIGNSPLGDPGGLRATFHGLLDDVRIYDSALGEQELLGIMQGEGYPFAFSPNPADGALLEATWANLSWNAGDSAVSHDVYFGDSLDDVNDGVGDSFQGNQTETFLVAGFPGFPVPGGLVPGTTYYWRIDEVNDADPNSPWKGDVWSFSIPPKTAYAPDPADGVGFVDPNATFSWTGGFAAKLHTVYMGTNFDDVNDAVGGAPQGATTYSPGPLELEKVYYWRVDEFDPPTTYKGDIWAFTTPGAVGNPQPANGAADVQMTATLSWTSADNAASHELYFGTDRDAVNNATAASPEYVGPKTLGSESYDPGKLAWDAAYYWRVDEVYPTETVKGVVWSFETADFILVDDFEAYNDIDPPDPVSNTIYSNWIDGYGIPTNGAITSNDLPPYAEQIIVHGGAQSMKYLYDTNLMISESTLTLVNPKDWTAEGVTKLSLSFRGASGNSAERMFVALGNAVVYHNDPAATQITGWNEWVIDLAAFVGVDLTNVNTISIGFGTKNSPAASGAGTMYFDDIRLIR